MVGMVGETRAAVEGEVGGLQSGFDEGGILADTIEDYRHVVGVLLGYGVDDGVDDFRRGVEDVERRVVEQLVGECVVRVVLVGEDGLL